MSFLASTSILALTDRIDVIGFIGVVVVRVFDVIVIIDFFVEDVVLNVDVLDFFSYSIR